MVLAFQYLGFETEEYLKCSLVELKEIIDKGGVPPIAHLNKGEDGHYIVVLGVGKNHVYISNPSKKNKVTRILKKRFYHSWIEENEDGGWMLIVTKPTNKKFSQKKVDFIP
jgi:ABC-type bacteriocin/lantibiotic exporter with double-glycine peptidase domain